MEAGHVFNDSDETASHLWCSPAGRTPAPATRLQEPGKGGGAGGTCPASFPVTAALQYITIVAPATSDSKYDFSCQAADRKQNIIYNQIQPAEAHTWLPEVRAAETHPRAGFCCTG